MMFCGRRLCDRRCCGNWSASWLSRNDIVRDLAISCGGRPCTFVAAAAFDDSEFEFFRRSICNSRSDELNKCHWGKRASLLFLLACHRAEIMMLTNMVRTPIPMVAEVPWFQECHGFKLASADENG